MEVDRPGRTLGPSGLALLPDLEGFESALQADHSGRFVGGLAAGIDDTRVHNFFGEAHQCKHSASSYPVFAYAGLLPWIFFSNAVTSGSYSLVANSHMITKVFFPRLIIPAAAVGVRLVDFLVGSLVLIALMLYYGIGLSWPKLLILPLLVLQLTLLAFALSALLSALNVKYRDTGTALPVLLQTWMFVSPIVYPATYVPRRWMWIYQANPLAGIV